MITWCSNFYDESRGCADRIFHRPGALGDVSLAFVVFGRLPAVAFEAALDLLPQLGSELGGDIQRQCNRLPGRIIHRGSQTTGGEDDIAAFQRLLDSLGDAPGVIPDGGFPVQVDARIAELARQVAGVAIQDFPEQDFRSDGDDLSRRHIFS